jgi:hypothetical protein
MTEESKRFSIVRVIILLIPLLALYWWILGAPGPDRHVREKARRMACRSNLKRIETAKRQWARNAGVTNVGTPVAVNDILSCLERSTLPECRSAGQYDTGTLGHEPRCSIHGTMSESFPSHDWNWEIEKLIKAPTNSSNATSEPAPNAGSSAVQE